KITYCDGLMNLGGLSNLHTIEDFLEIGFNNNLSNLNGLENLSSLGSILFEQNPQLESIDNLSNITTIDFIAIANNHQLTTLNGLQNIIYIELSLNILLNASLSEISLESLTAIGGSVDISFNDGLQNLSGLENLSIIGGDLRIEDNVSLLSLNDLEELSNIDGGLFIIENELLSEIGSLSNLFTANGLVISKNPQLTSLNGLESLTSLNNSNLFINFNNQLTNIDGVRNIEAATINNMYIFVNNSLSDCAVLSVCEHLDIDPDNTFIYDNGPNCQSQQEVEAACALGTEENQIAELKIYPNPTNSSFEVSGLQNGYIEIIDSQGRTVKQMPFNKMG